MSLNIYVPGEACAQGRPRFSSFTGKDGKTYTHAYDPVKSKNYKSFIKVMAIDAMDKQHWKYTDLPLEVEIFVYQTVPKSKTKKFKEAVERGQERPTTKPDVDNVAKTVLDALSGVIYKDDKQIVSLTVKKYYTVNEPYVQVLLKVWGW